VNVTLTWVLLGLGLAVLVVRRRSLAVGAVTVQSLVLAGLAFGDAVALNERIAASALVVRSVGLAAFFLLLITRSRELRPVRAGIAPLRRAALGVALALALVALVSVDGLGTPEAQRSVLGLVAFGLVVAWTRRATLFQILGVVLVENGLVLAALQLSQTSWLIEIGVAFDLTLIALVAGVFHDRIFVEFGAGDTEALTSLRD
jgi:hydrogenase-4 component E